MAANVDFDADVIVVGSGVIGSMAANHLARSGKKVIILEAGPRVPRWKIVESFRTSPNVSPGDGNRNMPYPDVPWAPTSFDEGYITNTGPLSYNSYFLRLVGGTTWHWGGACWRSLPNDFRLKSTYGVGRDYPLSYDDLEKYYTMVEYEMGISGDDHADYSGHGGAPFPPRSAPYPVKPQALGPLSTKLADRLGKGGYHFTYQPNGRATDPYDERPACVGNNNCSPVCPIGAQYSGDRHATRAEGNGATLLSDAVVYKLEKSPDGKKIVAVHYHTPTGKSVRLTSRYVIVAAHTLESVRLLLLSDVANSSDQVGRNLMDHNAFSMNFLANEPYWAGLGPVQQGDILDRRDGDFRRTHAAIRYEVANIAGNYPVTERLLGMGVTGKELDRRIREDASRYVAISSNIESLPIPTNRITLNPAKKDMFGLPLLSVHYDTTPYSAAGAQVAFADFKQFIALCGGTPLKFNTTEWENRAHPMGALIMGNDPKDSVVNHEGRTHDHENLFIASTGVIPASGVTNPTVTGTAIALRSAHIIAAEL